MTARALKMSATGTAKGRVNVLNTPTKNNQPAKSSSSSSSSSSKSGKETPIEKKSPTAVKLTTLESFANESPVNIVDPEEAAMLRATRPTNAEGQEEDDEIGSLVNTKREEADDSSVMIDDAKFDNMSRITEATREQDHEEHDAFWMPVC